MRSLTEIKARPVGDLITKLTDESEMVSQEAGKKLVAAARDFGLNVRDYLTLAVKPEGELSGYEMCLAALNLPIQNDFRHGVVLQAASDTFQTYPGTRAMFPEVIDDMLRWSSRQDQFEQVAPMLANSRTISQVEMISTVVNDDSADRDTSTVPEGARIPVRAIRTSQVTVGMFKHGSAIRTTYEFNRRASLDLLTPYANRIARELEISKVKEATNLLVNGDGVHAAAAVIAQSSYNSVTTANSTNGVISWEHLLYWLLQRAKAGVPVDVVVGNWDSAFKWARMWATPLASAGTSHAGNFDVVSGHLTAGGLRVPLPTFVLSSTASANNLIGYSKADTLEELVEGGSQISESEKAILNQTVTYVKTENTGYRLVYGDTRSIFNYGG